MAAASDSAAVVAVAVARRTCLWKFAERAASDWAASGESANAAAVAGWAAVGRRVGGAGVEAEVVVAGGKWGGGGGHAEWVV